MGVIRKIGKNWYVDIYHEGRRIRKKVGSKKDAENAIIAIQADIFRGEFKFSNNRRIKFEKFADEYLNKYSKINKRSWKRDESSLKNLLPYFKEMILPKITPKHIEDYKKLRLEKVKPPTVNRELALLKNMFTIATKWRYFDGENPVRQVKLFQERELEMRILKKDEIDRLIENACDHLKAIIIVAFNTGMRRDEILKLRWNDIDFDKYYIYVKETKGGRSRKIPMNSLVAETLKDIKRGNEFVFYNPNTNDRIKDIKTGFQIQTFGCKSI